MSDPRPYRPGVGIILLNTGGKVFVAERLDTPGAWQMPQGGIDDGEDPATAARRELLEETGTDRAELIAESPDWLAYDLPDDLSRTVWKGKYRGQKQKWYIFRFTGQDSDINIHTDHPEFSNWRWAAPADLPTMIVGFKQDLYRRVIAAFPDHLQESTP